MDGHYTQDEWDNLVHTKFQTLGDAERWRNANNVFVDGYPPPTYTGPLSTGGSTGTPPQTQGLNAVEEDDQTGYAPQGALSGMYIDPREYAAAQKKLDVDTTAYGAQSEIARKAQYDKARDAILAQRMGPSSSEQLFALAAAIGKPMVNPSFGGVMSNVGATMGDISRATREAQVSRADALARLEQSMVSGTQAAQLAELEGRRKTLQAQAPILAAQMRAANPDPYKGAVWDPARGAWITRPGSGAAPIPVATKVVNGQQRVIYSDGSFTVDGKAHYDSQGNYISG